MPPKQAANKRKRAQAQEASNNNNSNVEAEGPIRKLHRSFIEKEGKEGYEKLMQRLTAGDPTAKQEFDAKLEKQLQEEFGQGVFDEWTKTAKEGSGGLTGMRELIKKFSQSTDPKAKEMGKVLEEVAATLYPNKIYNVNITGDLITFTPPIDKISVSDFVKVSEKVLAGVAAVKALNKLIA